MNIFVVRVLRVDKDEVNKAREEMREEMFYGDTTFRYLVDKLVTFIYNITTCFAQFQYLH